MEVKGRLELGEARGRQQTISWPTGDAGCGRLVHGIPHLIVALLPVRDVATLLLPDVKRNRRDRFHNMTPTITRHGAGILVPVVQNLLHVLMTRRGSQPSVPLGMVEYPVAQHPFNTSVASLSTHGIVATRRSFCLFNVSRKNIQSIR